MVSVGVESATLRVAAPAAATPGAAQSCEATAAKEKRRLPVLSVKSLLETQKTLTAVERFAQLHDEGDVPAQQQYYRDLLPTARPGKGQQFAFEVDLDKCTACKACVSACHTLNGLDEDEMWRGVGILHGGTPEVPVLQTITSSCHHCVEPGCMSGCPVNAYEKDPVTGIVRHLDDQCIGCQYCTLMCPYDAPKYSESRGIVRKCDMCSDRLAHGEAPACVQACPNGAIAITIVDQAAALAKAAESEFLRGAPVPEHTVPTTVYKSKQPLAVNVVAGDHCVTRSEHAHLPLVVMLTAMQLAAGLALLSTLADLSGHIATHTAAVADVVAATIAGVGLAASVFHLGRPLYAFRGVLNIRRSWLSREALAFGVFAQLLAGCALLSVWPLVVELPALAGVRFVALLSQLLNPTVLAGHDAVRWLTCAVGLIGIFASAMVYVATRRAQWSLPRTSLQFFGGVAVLGANTLLAIELVTSHGAPAPMLWTGLVALVVSASLLKLGYHARILSHLSGGVRSVEQRMAELLKGELSLAFTVRVACGALGGIVLPLSAWLAGTALPHAVLWGLMAIAVLLTGIGELAERVLFYSGAPGSRMPGGIR